MTLINQISSICQLIADNRIGELGLAGEVGFVHHFAPQNDKRFASAKQGKH